MGDLPLTMMASKPAYFISGAQYPPELASPTPPVMGDFAATIRRLAEGSGVPLKGPAAKTMMLSGERGSTPARSSSYRILALKPLPPMYFRAKSLSRGFTWTDPSVRST